MLPLPNKSSQFLTQWHRHTRLTLQIAHQIQFDFRRHLRIKKADNTVESGTDPSEKDYTNVDGWARGGPSEAHATDKGGHGHREGSLDPQSQGAQSSMRGPKSETPSSIHGQLYKGDSTGTDGAERGGHTEAAPPGSWWEAIKHRFRLGAREWQARKGG